MKLKLKKLIGIETEVGRLLDKYEDTYEVKVFRSLEEVIAFFEKQENAGARRKTLFVFA